MANKPANKRMLPETRDEIAIRWEKWDIECRILGNEYWDECSEPQEYVIPENRFYESCKVIPSHPTYSISRDGQLWSLKRGRLVRPSNFAQTTYRIGRDYFKAADLVKEAWPELSSNTTA